MVSVIIPCFNSEKYIDETMMSVYIQDYPEIELIVVDDGSTDNSKEHILSWKEKFASKGYILHYIYQTNQGQGKATEAGLKYVSGKYLTLLDADDCFLQGSISKRAVFLDQNSDYAGVRSGGWMDTPTGRKSFTVSEKEKTDIDYFRAIFFNGAVCWAGSYMVRTDLLLKFYAEKAFYPSRFGQNLQIVLPVAYKHKFGYIDEPLMVYNVHPDSHSQGKTAQEQVKKSNNNFYGYLDIYRHMIDSIIKDEDEKTQYSNRLDSWLYRHKCETAIDINDKRELRKNYILLVMTRQATLQDRIKFNRYLNPVKYLFYRCLRSLSGFIDSNA